jgi:hypothetical protein
MDEPVGLSAVEVIKLQITKCIRARAHLGLAAVGGRVIF